MGLIKAGVGAAGGVLADQWKEYFYADALANDVLLIKAEKRIGGRSSNTKGHDNIITAGSLIAISDGQAMAIVDQGKVVEFSAEPGEFFYDASTEPTIFSGALGKAIKDSFKVMGKRFTFGGEPAKDQRVYYFNLKEILGNKYGTPSAVPFRVIDANIGLDMDIGVSCFGEYSFKISDPIRFYSHVAGNISGIYRKDNLESQLKTELLSALQPAFFEIARQGIRYYELPGHSESLASILNQVLSKKWQELRGLEIASFAISSLKANPEDEKMIKELQRNAALRDPSLAAAHLVGAQAEAMQQAASNTGAGPLMGFMGMNFAQQAGGASAQNLYSMGAGVATGGPGWTCSCGKVNQGKFCSNCGLPKPSGVPQYRCDKCGWQPKPDEKLPKFCPDCGDPFDDGDVVK